MSPLPCSFAVAVSAGLVCLTGFTPDTFPATARSLGQPLSSYGASLYGKTSLTARQTQTLTADPEAPLYGATSVDYDPAVVHVTGYGFGPAYSKSFLAPEEF